MVQKKFTTFATVTLLCLAMATPVRALEPDREEPHHWRMIVETGVYLLLGTAWYFSGQDLNAPDWDLTVTGDDLKKKFLGLTQIRFDNNSFLFNQAYHPLAHAGIYLTARANDMSPYLSFAYVFFASLIWEYVGELREKVSINDMIVSPMTGMAWGEVAYQYGEYFASDESRGRLVHRVLTGFVALPRTFHDWLDDERPPVFEVPRFHPEPRAATMGGVRFINGKHHFLTSFELESKLTVMPGFGAAGRDLQTFRDGNFSRFKFELQISPDQIEADIDATATIGGLYGRDIREDVTGKSGVEWMIGGGRGYRLLSREGEQFADRVGIAHLIGPTFRMRLFAPGDLMVDVGLNGFFDFSAVRNLAVGQFADAYGEETFETIRTDTQKHAYYFGWGFTFSPSIAFELKRWRLELSTDVSQIYSIQGLDRFQEEVTRTIKLHDLVWESEAAIVVPLPVKWLDVRLQAHHEERLSRLDEFRADRKITELEIGLQSRF